ncbi:hypothetical protein Tco_0852331 [Tanacetum coccineum]
MDIGVAWDDDDDDVLDVLSLDSSIDERFKRRRGSEVLIFVFFLASFLSLVWGVSVLVLCALVFNSFRVEGGVGVVVRAGICVGVGGVCVCGEVLWSVWGGCLSPYGGWYVGVRLGFIGGAVGGWGGYYSA